MLDRYTFENTLDQAAQYWLPLTKAEVKAALGEAVMAMVAFDQRNPHHCYDLFSHCMHTVAGLPEDADTLLKTAAFFHDIGKPVVAKEKQGRLVFYGHAKKSALIARPLLEQLGYTQPEIREICFYIEHHDDFISWVLPEEDYEHKNTYLVPITEQNLSKHIEKTNKKEQENIQEKWWLNLLDLCMADAGAQAESVVQNSVVVDSKAHKQKKIRQLQTLLRR